MNAQRTWHITSLWAGWISLPAAFPLAVMFLWALTDSKGGPWHYVALAVAAVPAPLAVLAGVASRRRGGTKTGIVLGVSGLALALLVFVGVVGIMRNFRDI